MSLKCSHLILPFFATLLLTSCSASARKRTSGSLLANGQGAAIPLFAATVKGQEALEGLHAHLRNARATKDEIEYQDEEDYDEGMERLDQIEQERLPRQAADPGGPKNLVSNDVGLPNNYNKYEIPKDPAGNPIPLYIYINVINILDWDELNEMLHIDLEMKVMWTDFKIMYYNNQSGLHNGRPTIENLTEEEIRAKRITLNNPYILEKVWKPNLFMENLLSIKQPTLMARPLTIKFIPEVGWFEYLTRISVKMDCEMDFHKYPADTQECKFALRGFSYPKKDLNLNWHRNGVFLNDLTLPSFDVVIKSTGKYDVRLHKNMDAEHDPDDVFEVLSFTLAARRQLSYHIVQTYLASTFYIVITTLCFLLPARMIEARIGITMTTLLTLTAMFAAVRDSTPIASYVKAIDIWMVGCIFFVFLVLAQFTVHTWITGGKVDEEQQDSLIKSPSLRVNAMTKEVSPEKEPTDLVPEYREARGRKKASPRALKWAHLSESYSFPVFLAIFAVYTIIYWSWLLTSANYYDWKVNATLNDVVDFTDD